MKHQVLGSLRPTVDDAIGLTTRFAGHYPMGFAFTELVGPGSFPPHS